MLHIRPAYENEATKISALAFASKAHWGYDDDFMAACIDDLTLSMEDCSSGLTVVAVENRDILAGFYKLGGKAPAGELQYLFIRPESICQGVGRLLLDEAANHGRQLGFTSLRIEADPNAEGFYLNIGAQNIGMVASGVIPDRQVPLLSLSLL